MEQHYWRKDWFESLKHVASVNDNENWSEYRAYCEQLEKGLRKSAFDHLNQFIVYLQSSTLENRMDFINWIMPIATTSPNLNQLLPYPLSDGVVKTTLPEYIALNEKAVDAVYWLAILTHDSMLLKKALEIEPSHAISRSRLISWMLGDLDHATHHLPDYLIGDQIAILDNLQEIENYLDDSLSERQLEMFKKEIAEFRSMIAEYQSKREEEQSLE